MKPFKLIYTWGLCLGLMLLMGLNLKAQQSKQEKAFDTVSGIVRDSTYREPLCGAVIRNLRYPKTGAIADINGHYKIKASKGDTLSVSYIGYYQRMVVVERDSLDVYLISKPMLMECVVITGADASAKMSSAPAQYNIMPYAQLEGRDEYKHIKQNGFLSVKHNPLSTFSTDIDVASYSLVRTTLSDEGTLPDANAVRTEELLNYFDYNYPKPQGDEVVALNGELLPCPWQKGHLVARIGLRAKEIPATELPPSHLVFLIDVSGSMYGPNRIGLVKSSLRLLTNNLRAEDKVSIVVYAGSSGLVLPPTSGADKKKIIDALARLEAGGSTAGEAGIKLAYKVAQEHFIKGGNNRVILCTDGDFNVGVSSEAELKRLIEEQRKSGVFLTVLGYGMGNHKDNNLQTLAEAGNGNHAYIDNLQEANKVLVEQFGSTMYAVAKDVKLQVEFNPQKVAAYRLLGYESRLMNDEDFKDDSKDAAELGAGSQATALYEIIPVGVKSRFLPKMPKLKYSSLEAKPNTQDYLTVSLRYKPIGQEVSTERQLSIATHSATPSNASGFAMAVAMFAEKLRKSDYSKGITYKGITSLAEQNVGEDKEGYRREFIRLVRLAEGLEGSGKSGDKK